MTLRLLVLAALCASAGGARSRVFARASTARASGAEFVRDRPTPLALGETANASAARRLLHAPPLSELALGETANASAARRLLQAPPPSSLCAAVYASTSTQLTGTLHLCTDAVASSSTCSSYGDVYCLVCGDGSVVGVYNGLGSCANSALAPGVGQGFTLTGSTILLSTGCYEYGSSCSSAVPTNPGPPGPPPPNPAPVPPFSQAPPGATGTCGPWSLAGVSQSQNCSIYMDAGSTLQAARHILRARL